MQGPGGTCQRVMLRAFPGNDFFQGSIPSLSSWLFPIDEFVRRIFQAQSCVIWLRQLVWHPALSGIGGLVPRDIGLVTLLEYGSRNRPITTTTTKYVLDPLIGSKVPDNTCLSYWDGHVIPYSKGIPYRNFLGCASTTHGALGSPSWTMILRRGICLLPDPGNSFSILSVLLW